MCNRFDGSDRTRFIWVFFFFLAPSPSQTTYLVAMLLKNLTQTQKHRNATCTLINTKMVCRTPERRALRRFYTNRIEKQFEKETEHRKKEEGKSGWEVEQNERKDGSAKEKKMLEREIQIFNWCFGLFFFFYFFLFFFFFWMTQTDWREAIWEKGKKNAEQKGLMHWSNNTNN